MSKIDDLIKYYNWKSDPDPEWSGPATADYNILKEEIENDLDRLEKLEKAIKILKEKEVDIDILNRCENVSEYKFLYFVKTKIDGSDYSKDILNEEEYELLKEVLEDEENK